MRAKSEVTTLKEEGALINDGRAQEQVIWHKLKDAHSKVDRVDSYYLETEGEVVRGLRKSVCSCSPLSSMTEVTKSFVQWRLEMGKNWSKEDV